MIASFPFLWVRLKLYFLFSLKFVACISLQCSFFKKPFELIVALQNNFENSTESSPCQLFLVLTSYHGIILKTTWGQYCELKVLFEIYSFCFEGHFRISHPGPHTEFSHHFLGLAVITIPQLFLVCYDLHSFEE